MSEADGSEHLTVEITTDGVFVVQGDIDIAGGPVLEAAMIEFSGSAFRAGRTTCSPPRQHRESQRPP